MTDTFQNMSSQELFELAKSRQMEEEKNIREQLRSELDELRKERRQLIAQHKKELVQLDDKIEKIREQLSPGGSSPSSTRNSSTNVSAAVLSTLQTHKQMSTKEIQAELTKSGVAAANLSQTLAYLKRQGKISSPERAVYAII